MSGKRMVMHPAWQAAHDLLNDGKTWFRTVELLTGGYSSAQVAIAMRCMGYGDDVIVTEWSGARAVAWALPDIWIPVDNNNSLDAYPGVLAMLNMPTLEDVLADPAGFAAGFELVDESMHALPAHAAAVLNGVKG
jgi:hypothetical protein